MKDYTLTIKDKEERKKQQRKFILGYKVKENKIGKKIMVIHYADGNVASHMEYSREVERAVLYLMECQIKKYEPRMQEYEMEYKDKLESANFEYKIGALSVCIIAGIIGLNVLNISMIMFSYLLAIFMFLVGDLTLDIFSLVKEKMIINDFNKAYLFTLNKEKINKNMLDKDNKFIREISDILDKICIEISDGKKEITINSLDEISLKKLEKVVKNVKLKETFEVIEQAYAKKKEITLSKGKEIEKQVLEERRRPFEALLTIEDVARLRSVDELNYQYRLNDENKSSFINVRDRYSSSFDLDTLERQSKRRVRRR